MRIPLLNTGPKSDRPLRPTGDLGSRCVRPRPVQNGCQCADNARPDQPGPVRSGRLSQRTAPGGALGWAFFLLLLCLWSLALPAGLRAETPPGTTIVNTAHTDYQLANGVPLDGDSNEVSLLTLPTPTPASIEFLRYAAGWDAAENLAVPTTAYSTTGSDGGPFQDLAPGPPVAGAGNLDLSLPVPLVIEGLFHEGDLLFLRVLDGDQNLSWNRIDTVVVEVTCAETGDREWLELREEGPNSGVFVGYLPTTAVGGATPGDGRLSIQHECNIEARYVDPNDAADIATTASLFDPIGRVFDSRTGLPVDGAQVTLLDADSGEPATVFGDDGISAFPATVTSGGTTQDAGGRSYEFGPGVYRFPMVRPGRYRIRIVPPEGYAFASSAAVADLQDLPAGPYALDPAGSYGQDFTVAPAPVFRLDLPVDPTSRNLWLRKTADKLSAAIGEFVPYRLTVENADQANPTRGGVTVTDRLPPGFRYQAGSARLAGAPVQPEPGPDGRTLLFHLDDLGPGQSAELRYVALVGPGSRRGQAINRAVAATGEISSGPAEAAVTVEDTFFQDSVFLLGQVRADACGALPASEQHGVAGVRLFLEDGSYVVSDKDGLFHFEGVRPGTHVVQVDPATVPEQYRVVSCTPNTRVAGRADSRFVEVQGGTVWQTDFHLAPKAPPTGEVGLKVTAIADGADTIGYRVRLHGSGVVISHPRLSVILPKGLTFVPGSASVDGASQADPSGFGEVLTFSLETPEQPDWSRTLAFRARPEGATGDLVTRALVTFDTPAAKNQRTPMAQAEFRLGRGAAGAAGGPALATGTAQTAASDALLLWPGTAVEAGAGNASPSASAGKGSVSSATARVETRGTWAPASIPPPVPAAPAAAAMPEFGDSWLAQAKPGLAWVWPAPGWNPPIASMKLVAKHPAGGKVQLLQEGKPVSPLCFEGTRKNQAGTLAVSRWWALDLRDGDNHFTLVVKDAAGKEVGRLQRTVHYSGPPVRATVVPELSHLVVDGKTPPVIAVRLVDKDGFPARQGIIGDYAPQPPYQAWQDPDQNQRDILTENNQFRPQYTVAGDGIAYLPLDPQSPAGEAVLNIPLANDRQEELRVWLQPAGRDWILVGLAEGTLGYQTLSQHLDELPEGAHEDFYREGRMAFFAKGQVLGKWLLTMAYDSAKPGLKDRQLFQTIDPDTYYPIYGDATTQGYEAPSTRKLYVKLERSQFYALFGDFDTGLTVTDLSRYSRSLTGFKVQAETDDYSLNLFASDTGQLFVKDELRGDGTSGLYHLSHQDLVLNSEKVRIEVRDRLRSEVVLSSRPLARHTGYNIDYNDGTLYFKEPIPARDEDFNPVYIVVDYEVTGNAEAWSYGGRGALRFLDRRLEVGASHIHEDRGTQGDNLYGLDATAQLTPELKLHAEAARTESEGTGTGGADGNAYLAELEQRSADFDGLLYYREQESGFGLGQQSGTESGTRKIGLDANYRLNDRWHFDGTAFRQYNLDQDAHRDLAEGTVNYDRQRFHLTTGLRQATDTYGDGTEDRSTQLTLGGDLQVTEKVLLRARHEQSLGSNANSDFPTRTLVGADYRLNEQVSLFAEQEFANGDNIESEGTRAGLRLTPWNGGQVNSSLEQQISENRSRIFALLGLAQNWQISEKWSADASLDRSYTVRGKNYRLLDQNVPPAVGSSEDFTAVSLGLGYHESEWSWTNRIEWRTADSEDRWGLALGVIGQVRRDLGISARFQGFYTDAADGNVDTSTELRLGVAWRPWQRRLVLLDRLDLASDRQKDSSTNLRNWRVVNNLALNARYGNRLQFALQYGTKYVEETIDGGHYSGFTDLYGLETRYDLTPRWDLGLRGSALHSWQESQVDYSTGASVGCQVMTNVWVSLGYNLVGFSDPDFSAADYTAQGPFLRFRMKFDQKSAGDIKAWLKAF